MDTAKGTVLRLRATMQAPVVVRDPLHLDGLLAAVCLDSDNVPTRADGPDEIKTPDLSIIEFNGVIYASAWIFPEHARYQTEKFVRRRDGEDLDWLTRKINRKSGANRDYMQVTPIIETQYIDWYCLWIGDRNKKQSRIWSLIRRVESVGALRRMGFGQVKSWEIEKMKDMPADQILVRKGLAMRNLPVHSVKWCDQTQFDHVRAPYWHPSTIEECVIKGTRCELAW